MSSDEEINVRVYNAVSPGVVNITSIVVEYDFFFSPVARPGTGSGVVLDRAAGTYRATEHLIGFGHRKIAFVGGDWMSRSLVAVKAQGYFRAMQVQGLTP